MMEGGESKEGGEKFKRKDEGKILKKGRAGLMNYTLGEGKMKEGGGSKEGVKRRKKEY